MINCIFNSNDLNANGYEILDIDYGMPTSIVNKYQLVRSDGQVTTGQNFGERKIKITGRILASNLKDLDEKLDILKTYFVGVNKNLDLTISDTTRRYVGTMDSFKYNRVGQSCGFEVGFTCDAFGKGITATTLTMGIMTLANESYGNTILGIYKTKPIIDMTVNYVDYYWGTKYIQIQNAVANQTLRLSRTWNWYDRVVIDGDAKTVSLYPTTKTVIDACDVTTGWTSTHTLSLETSSMKQGVGALKNVMAGAHDHCDFIRLNATAIDLSATTGKVIIPIFIPTPTAGAVASVQLWIGKNATLAADYDYWTVTKQWDGSALATNAWNYVVFNMATAVTGTNGTPNRALIKSILVSIVGTAGTMQLNGALMDYITLQKAGVTAQIIDYEGIFPDLTVGATTLIVADEFTTRNITLTGTYFKRWI